MADLPSIVLWPATKTRAMSPPPSPGASESYALPQTPNMHSGVTHRTEWIMNAPFPTRIPVDPLTPPASPEDLKFNTDTAPVTTMSQNRSRPPQSARYPLSLGPKITHEASLNVPTGMSYVDRGESGSRRGSVEQIATASKSLLRKVFNAVRFKRDGSSAVAEKRKILALNGSTREPMFKWRYKRALKKRAVLLVLVVFMIYHFYRIFGGSDFAQFKLSRTNEDGDALNMIPGFIKPSLDNKKPTPLPTRRTPTPPTPKQKKQTAIKSSNKYHPIVNGLLTVDTSLPVSAHPILQLIERSKADWDMKVSKQSQTLRQAVVEYKRRNRGRNPPKGFDKWWKMVKENNVQLPDEYDQINADLNIFRALSPYELNKRLDQAMGYPDTFHVTVQDGVVTTGGTYSETEIEGATDRMSSQMNLLQEFNVTSWLPNVRAVFGVHDTPLGFIGADHRSDLMNAVDDDEYYDPSEELDVSVRGWSAACPPRSPLRLAERGLYRADRPVKSFVADISANTDLCNNPHIIGMHGITAGKSPNVAGRLEPTFSLSKTSLHTDVLAVPIEQWVESLPSIPWSERNATKLLWRGSNTGIYHAANTPWRDTHRARLVRGTSKYLEGEVDILPTPGMISSESKNPTLQEAMLHVPKGITNARMFDVAFAGHPIQCDVADGTCRDLADEYDFKTTLMTFEQALEYKYVLDVDGNSWSARTQRLLMGGSLVFKSSINPEWWSSRIQPWVHYVPVGIDYSDLLDAFAFFHGDANGVGGRDDLAEQIAKEGQDWAKTHWRRVDMAAYMSRLYLEWARLTAPSRRSMDFVYSEDMEI